MDYVTQALGPRLIHCSPALLISNGINSGVRPENIPACDYQRGKLIYLSATWIKKIHEPLTDLGPVSQKSWNFSGLFQAPQFPLYLRNAGVLSHQTSQSYWLFLHYKNMPKNQLFRTSILYLKCSLFGPEKYRKLYVGCVTSFLEKKSKKTGLTNLHLLMQELSPMLTRYLS